MSNPPPRPLFGAPADPRRGIAAIVLAAGRGQRWGGGAKLLARFRGRPLVCWPVRAALAAGAWPVVVVTGGPAADGVRAAVAGLNVRVVDNPQPEAGLASSLRAGLGGLPHPTAVAVLLADMPLVTAQHLRTLITAYEAAGGDVVCAPSHHGQRGNPVLWPSRFLPWLAGLSGDQGGRGLLGRLGAEVVDVAMADDGVVTDVDTPAALRALHDRSPFP